MLWSPFLLLTHGGVLLARALDPMSPPTAFPLPTAMPWRLAPRLYGFLGLCAIISPRPQICRTGVVVRCNRRDLVGEFASGLPLLQSVVVACSLRLCCAPCFSGIGTRRVSIGALPQWLLLGVIVGLMLDVYYANLMVLSVLAVEAIGQYLRIFRSGPASRLFPLLTGHFLFGLVVCVAMLPTFVTRAIVYGGPFESGYYSLRTFLWSSPALWSVLFSSNHGLLAWTPILAFAIIGLCLFAFRLPKIGIPFLTALVALYLFISLYPNWAGVSSYGNRFFVSLTPLFILGLAYFLDRGAALFSRQSTALAVCSVVLACFTLWNLGMIYQWGTHMIPVRGPISFREAAYNQFSVVPSRLSSNLHAYFFGRSALMKQIEQKDLEQLNEGAKSSISR